MRNLSYVCASIVLFASSAFAQGAPFVHGRVIDQTGAVISGANVTCGSKSSTTNASGEFSLDVSGCRELTTSAAFAAPVKTPIAAEQKDVLIRLEYVIPKQHESVVITASALDPAIDRRNEAVYSQTLFSRDDQIMDTLAAGINAGQHEGGGKSIEVRRFGFNLDHGGVSGGLKVLVDNVQQNQGTQGHGQGYLGQLKSLTPELVEDVDILNGPFSAEYGDFSGLGVVHIRTKERLADRAMIRLQGGSFGAFRTFVGYSPRWQRSDGFLAYEAARTDGPFKQPLDYLRHNITTNLTKHFSDRQALGFKFNIATNRFTSSGQIPLDLVDAGSLHRFGNIDPFGGGRNRSGTAAVYYKRDLANGDIFKADGFVSRSLFDLWSNFTFFLNDEVNGDEFQQHDSRLQEGANVQWLHPWKLAGKNSLLTVGSNFHDNQINVGLIPTRERVAVGPSSLNLMTFANARVTNGAWYAQNGLEVVPGRLRLELGLRYDVFRFDVRDHIVAANSGVASEGRLQPKANLTFTPFTRVPASVHFSYGRGISSQDARGVVQNPAAPKLATTDFFQAGTSHQWKRISVSTDMFLIDRSNEQVYVPDDGSLEFRGPTRSYGWETKTSLQVTSKLSFNGSVTQVTNAFYRGTGPRVYVDSAPHTVINGGLTLSGWRGTYASLRYRHTGSYRLDGSDDTIRASGLDVMDFSASKSLRHNLDLNFSVENLTNKRYYETQNYFESRVAPGAPVGSRIHATPGYPVGVTVGLTWRFE